MKGSIRILVGFCVAYGAIGTLDMDPTASILIQGLLCVAGLATLYSGIRAMDKQRREVT
jgi:hypothetical protein